MLGSVVIKPAVGVADFASNVTEGQLGYIYIESTHWELRVPQHYHNVRPANSGPGPAGMY